jgi:hypothetical protein
MGEISLNLTNVFSAWLRNFENGCIWCGEKEPNASEIWSMSYSEYALISLQFLDVPLLLSQ